MTRVGFCDVTRATVLKCEKQDEGQYAPPLPIYHCPSNAFPDQGKGKLSLCFLTECHLMKV